MLITTPSRIATYSRCPLRAKYSWDYKDLLGIETELLKRVVRQVYSFQMRFDKIAPWRKISGWLDKEFRDLASQLPDIEQTYKESKNVLSRLHKWYYQYYRITNDSVIANLPIIVRLNSYHEYHDVIDILGIKDKITIYDFDELQKEDEKPTGMMIYNDIKALARIWGLRNTKGSIQPQMYTRFFVTPRSIQEVSIQIKEETLYKADRIVRHILQGIERGAFYPSISEQCSHCPHSAECYF